MKKYFPFNSRAEADKWAADMDTKFGYPDGKTMAYTEILDHPSNGKSYALTCPKCYGSLTEAQIDSLLTREEVDAIGLMPLLDWLE